MTSLLLMGLLIGMRHALEADHLAALASLCGRGQSLDYAVRQGLVWGLGHTLMLLLFGAAVVLMEFDLSRQLAAGLETAVGCMLVLLGADLLRRLLRHQTQSPAGTPGSRQCTDGDPLPHKTGFPLRALLVGLMHGMAGSAALTVMTLQTVDSSLAAMLYILLFGMGSIIGMVLISTLIALPLLRLENRRVWLYNAVQLLLGCATSGLGVLVVYQSHAGLIA